jgi:hypothetical protein
VFAAKGLELDWPTLRNALLDIEYLNTDSLLASSEIARSPALLIVLLLHLFFDFFILHRIRGIISVDAINPVKFDLCTFALGTGISHGALHGVSIHKLEPVVLEREVSPPASRIRALHRLEPSSGTFWAASRCSSA